MILSAVNYLFLSTIYELQKELDILLIFRALPPWILGTARGRCQVHPGPAKGRRYDGDKSQVCQKTRGCCTCW